MTLRTLTAAAVAALFLTAASGAQAATPRTTLRPSTHGSRITVTVTAGRIGHLRDLVWGCQRNAGLGQSTASGALRELASASVGYRAWVARLWQGRLSACRAYAASLPAHLSLWRCIEKGESGGDGVHPGATWASNGSHFNVLQMTDPWGDHFHPIGQSYQTVEAEAERQYTAALRIGRSYALSWLNGQWGQTISGCWGYA